MPFSPPPRTPSGPRRRALFVSAAGAALSAGCSAGSDGSGGTTGGSPSVAARARARAARDSQGLAERYDAVLAAYPALADRLGPLRAAVAGHTEAFGGRAPEDAAQGAPAKASGASPSLPSSASPSPAVPGTERDALAELAAAERALADRRAKALLDVPGELARLLASVAAAGAAHAYLLTEGTK
ncbi:hypothetical protein ACFYRY_18825 [Streptomyces sp. NPDC005263]|uniref:hypothetical protein n=1 Tax=Streptomyces sp. NPDC005263 TaxID=3364711 RepID=UPI00368C194F